MDIAPDVIVETNPVSLDHAVLRDVKAYWDALRGTRRMPQRADIRPADIKLLLPQVLLADVLDDDFRYRVVGSRLQPYFPLEATGKLFREALAPFGEATVVATLGAYRLVADERAPLRVKGPGHHFAQASKFFEAILMPLGDEDRVTMIFGAFEFDWDRGI